MKPLRNGPTRQEPRGGFTKIELLFVISVAVVLFALLAPALRHTVPASRRAQCLSNMKNVSLAVINFSNSHNGQIPRLSRTWTVEPDSPAALQAGSTTIQYGWFTDLLPHLDKKKLADSIAAGSTEIRIDPQMGRIMYPNIPVATCPIDTNNFKKNHGLSYIANAGYMTAKHFGAQNTAHDGLSIDYTGDGVIDVIDVHIAHSTGVFWRSLQDAVGGNEMAMTMDYIATGDGQTCTILLSESVQARFYTSPMTAGIAFGIINQVPTPTTATLNPSMALPTPFKLRRPTTNSRGPWDAINSDFKRSQGTTSRPSSNHPGKFNVSLCDGRCAILSEKIDEAVYARMLSPNGQRYRQRIYRESDRDLHN